MKTKNKIFISGGIVLMSFMALFITSCAGDFTSDTQGELTVDNLYSGVEDIERAALGVYSPLADKLFANSEAYCHLWAADDMTAVTGSNKADFLEYDQLKPLNTNPKMARSWALLWEIVGAANSFTDNEEKMLALEGNNEETFKRFLGEVRFLRALAYYELVRGWGTVPLLTTQEGVTGQESLASFQEIYDFIINDLIYAKEHLGNTSVNGIYRANKWMAQSLLANVYLTTAGFPLKNTANYALAAAEAKGVIDNGPYALTAEFSGVMGNFENNLNQNGNTEIIIAFPADKRLDGWNAGNYQSEAVAFGDKLVEFGFYNAFPEGTRKDFTFKTTAGRPKYKKFGPAWDFSTNFGDDILYMRYAELLLIYAEAQIQASGSTSDADALSALNLVKVRAGLPEAVSATAMEVVWEKAWETAGEFSRWHDIVRTETLDEVNALRHATDNELTPLGSDLSEQNPWALIPFNDVKANPNLKK